MTNFGAQMREWRKRKLLSQKDFALTIGVVVRTVWGIEAGEHLPSFRTRRRFRELQQRYARSRMVSRMLPPKSCIL